MDPERWHRVEELYHAALDRRVDERAVFLAEACATDRRLREEVESLLRLAPSAQRFLDTPLSGTTFVGTHVGPYQITGLLGVGGMGEVYRALDPRLGREVAIKILPARFAEDPDRLGRFEREARLLAALNHPRIATIHGLERADSHLFLVLELVAGETLAERVAARRLDVGEALRLGRQVAEALEAAHERGIIHRDLKPANVRVTVNGEVKLLDFGLAKALAPESADLQAEAQRTSVGLVLGTAAYMSPEQARGKAVDQRADIWAFGCVLYELLSGRQAFPGETASDCLAAILGREPDWSALPAATPTEIRQVLHRCLQKDPAQRARHISDVRKEIEPASGVRGLAVRRAPWRPAAWVPLGLVVVAGFVGWLAWPRPQPQDSLLALPLTSFPGAESYPSISPDGRYVTFMWTGSNQDNPDIYVQQIGVGDPHRRTTNTLSDYNPVWSPDGRWIAFLRAERLPLPAAPAGTSEVLLIPPLNGSERKLGELRVRIVGTPGFLTWCPDSSCLIVTDSTGERQPDALFVLPLENGHKRQLTNPPPSALGDCNPAVSPDGTSLVFRRVPAASAGELFRLPLGQGLIARGAPERLRPSTLDAAYPAWLPDGKGILFSAGRRLWSLMIPGQSPPSLLPFGGEDGLMPTVSGSQLSQQTRLIYVRRFSDTNIWRLDTSANGAPALSPPAVAITSTRGDVAADFSPDGRRVAFASNRSGPFEIWVANPDGANAVQLTSMAAGMTAAPAWSPDGRIAFQSNVDGQFEIYVTSTEAAKPRRVTFDSGNDHVPSFSRDGRWIYFGSTRAADSQARDYQIWKVPTDGGGDAVQVTHRGGFKAIEGVDGVHVYYTERPGSGALWRVPTSGGPAVKLVEEVVSDAFAVLDKGIYYLDRPSSETRLRFFDFSTGKSLTVARGLGDVRPLLTASPDGRAILYTRLDATVEDLMRVDNFRAR